MSYKKWRNHIGNMLKIHIGAGNNKASFYWFLVNKTDNGFIENLFGYKISWSEFKKYSWQDLYQIWINYQ